jgi:hypothetical protein
MTDQIRGGTILVKQGALLPESLRFESEPYSKGWRLIKNLDGYGLDRKVSKTGWTFFSMAGETKGIGFGFDRQKALRGAVERVVASLKSKKFNCLEITQAIVRRFLGFLYVSVSARSRHIRKNSWAKDFAEWDRERLSASSTEA